MSTGAVSQVPLAIFSTHACLISISYTGALDEQLTLMDQRHGQPFVNVALKGLPFEGDTILGSLGFQIGLGALGILLVVLGVL